MATGVWEVLLRRNQTVLITGATRGIGRAAAIHLAERGHRVLATGRNEGLLRALQDVAGSRGLPLKAVPLDVTDHQAVEGAVSAAIKEFGRLDALVNNAGYGASGPLEETSLEDIRALFETNLFAVVHLCQAVLPHMRERGSGTIVNVGSVAGQIAAPMEGVYTGSKFALHGMTRALRMEVRRFGVRVALIEPGVIKTDFAENKAPARRVLSATSPYDSATRNTALRAAARQLVAAGPHKVATRIRQVIEARAPSPRYAVGVDARAGALVSRLLPDAVMDFLVRRAVTGP